ncbi:hypothetical protein ACHWQZ_G007312 [Mnemiopsis leidyi]
MDLSQLPKHSHSLLTVESTVPLSTQDEECCVGIDEAGRGPVLGPMVYGIAYCPISKIPDIEALGVADSKQLKESDRDEILEKIHENSEFVGYCVTVLSPNYLSTSMLGRENYNLNAISHDTAISLLRNIISKGVKVKDVYVDTVGPADKYQAKLSALFPTLNITVASKADDKYPICGASSICAKVCRDRCMNEWQFPEKGFDISESGCGYPSDPKTKKWLIDNVDEVFGFPQFVRFSWSTAEKIVDKHCARVLWDDEEEEEENIPKLNSFFKRVKKETEIPRHRFYHEQGLTSLTGI